MYTHPHTFLSGYPVSNYILSHQTHILELLNVRGRWGGLANMWAREGVFPQVHPTFLRRHDLTSEIFETVLAKPHTYRPEQMASTINLWDQVQVWISPCKSPNPFLNLQQKLPRGHNLLLLHLPRLFPIIQQLRQGKHRVELQPPCGQFPRRFTG